MTHRNIPEDLNYSFI